MPTSQLSAVPSTRRSPMAQQREATFRTRVSDAVSHLSGEAAVEEIVRLYVADTGSLEARLADANVEASTASQESRQRYEMMQHAHSAASQGLLTLATQAAEISACRGALGHLRHMVERADGGSVPVENLLATLSVEPPAPVYVPTITAFTPSARFRSGTFASASGDVLFNFVFVGYALVDHGPGAAGILEPVFLLGSRALPLSMIEHERRVKLKQMLPAVGQPLAA